MSPLETRRLGRLLGRLRSVAVATGPGAAAGLRAAAGPGVITIATGLGAMAVVTSLGVIAVATGWPNNISLRTDIDALPGLTFRLA